MLSTKSLIYFLSIEVKIVQVVWVTTKQFVSTELCLYILAIILSFLTAHIMTSGPICSSQWLDYKSSFQMLGTKAKA